MEICTPIKITTVPDCTVCQRRTIENIGYPLNKNDVFEYVTFPNNPSAGDQHDAFFTNYVVYFEYSGSEWVNLGYKISTESINWNTDISNKPSTFPPSTHTHPINQINSLQSTLDGLRTDLDNHQHDISDVVGLQTILDDLDQAVQDAADNWGIQYVETDTTLTGQGTPDSILRIADDAISTAKIQNSAVTSFKIQDNAITNPKILDASVTTPKILNAAVTDIKLASNSVSTAKIQDSAITNVKLAPDSISNSKIQDNAISISKLPSGASPGKFLTWNGWQEVVPSLVYQENPDLIEISTTGVYLILAISGTNTVSPSTSFTLTKNTVSIGSSSVSQYGKGIVTLVSSLNSGDELEIVGTDLINKQIVVIKIS